MNETHGTSSVIEGWPPPIGGDEEAINAASRLGKEGQKVVLRGGWGTISPSWAAEMLKGALSNLPVSEREIEVMAGEMTKWQWHATGEPIVLTEDNLLLGGRKRLMACVKANTPFVALLIQGVPADALDTMNNLRGRSLRDILKIEYQVECIDSESEIRRSHRRNGALATVLRLLWRMRRGSFETGAPMGTDSELFGLLAAYPGIIRAMDRVEVSDRILRLAPMVAVNFLFHHIDPEKAAGFFSDMMMDAKAAREGNDAHRRPTGTPIRAFHDRLLHIRLTDKKAEQRTSELLGSLVLAWNAYCTGRPARSLDWTPLDEDGNPQPFPEPYGWRPELELVPDLSTLTPPLKGGSDLPPSQAGRAFKSASGDIMAGFERHPDAQKIWDKTFPRGHVPSVTLRMIGGPEAKALLDKNTANRNRTYRHVERYKRDIRAGRFISLNGETIKIAESGRFLDGQHRITGVEETQVRMPFLIVEGLDEDAFKAMDRANTKGFAKVLTERQIPNAVAVASAVKLQWHYEDSGFAKMHGVSLSNRELLATLAENPGLVDACEFHNGLRRHLVQKVAFWVEYQLKQADPDKAREFLHGLASGVNLPDGSPILVLGRLLREEYMDRMLSKPADKAARRDKLEEEADVRQAALTILAFNAWVAGKTINKRYLTRWTNVATHGFPEIALPGTEGTNAVLDDDDVGEESTEN